MVSNTKLFFVLVFVVVILIFYNVSINREFQSSKISTIISIELPSIRDINVSVSNHKTILFGTPVFRNSSWYMSSEPTLGPDFFKHINCPITNCTLTSKKKYLKSIDKYDAIVFHVAENWNKVKMPHGPRRPEQIYVFATREAPIFHKGSPNLSYKQGFFNWSMTYQTDSDIQYFYALVTDSLSNEVIAPADDVDWKSPNKHFFGKYQTTFFCNHITVDFTLAFLNQMKIY